MTQEAPRGWHAWNAKLSAFKTLLPGLTPKDRLFINNGELSLTDSPNLTAFEQAIVDNMEAAGHKNIRLKVHNNINSEYIVTIILLDITFYTLLLNIIKNFF